MFNRRERKVVAKGKTYYTIMLYNEYRINVFASFAVKIIIILILFCSY